MMGDFDGVKRDKIIGDKKIDDLRGVPHKVGEQEPEWFPQKDAFSVVGHGYFNIAPVNAPPNAPSMAAITEPKHAPIRLPITLVMLFNTEYMNGY